MAYIIQDTTLSRIAEAIRAKNGTTDKIKVSDMAATIEAIKAGGDDKEAAIIDRSITEYSNGSIETIGGYAFYQCSSLLSVDLPSATSIGYNAFYYCEKLTTVDLPMATSIGAYVCSSCPTLKALIIRTGQVCSLDSGLGYGTDSCYIYVPRALINDYKAATNWAQYADKFRALEDYTVDGTTTGELDTTKI